MEEHRLGVFIAVLRGIPVSSGIVEVMLMRCFRQVDFYSTQKIDKLARDQGVCLSAAT